MPHVDLAVVGASFAGLSCAQAAATRGLLVTVLERKADAGDAVRSTGVLVKELADEWDVPRRLTRKVHGVRLYGPSLRHVDLHAPGYYFLATRTPDLLRWLVREAKFAGARVQTGCTFRGAERAGDAWAVHGSDVKARYLVGGDGAKSRVAQTLGLGRNRRFLVGLELEFHGIRGVEEDLLHVFLDSTLAPGYIAWVVPGVGVTQVGLARTFPGVPDAGAFVSRISRVFDFSAAREVGRRAGLIPVGGPVRPVACDGAMLIGDAAGLVSPLTAGGIHTAVHFGRLAGVAITDHLLDAGPEPWSVVRPYAPTFFWKRGLRRAAGWAPTNTLLDAALASAPMRRLAKTIFFHHRGLFSLDAWRSMIASGA